MSEVGSRTAETQSEATDPTASAWVSANAGSGKTYVLARRVIRLLLNGTDPARILCLTFTKAAAAEMAKRVFDILGEWTTLSDDALKVEITKIEGGLPSTRQLVLARKLFAKALDTPGGLKIQTIHAFCERLLHQFPFEANVAGHFEVLDERNEQALKEEAQSVVLAKAYADPGGVLGTALATVLPMVSDNMHERSLAEFIGERDAIGGWLAGEGIAGVDGAIADLRRRLLLSPDETSESLRAALISENPFTPDELERLLLLLRGGSTRDLEAADRLAPYLRSANATRRYATWLAVFLTGQQKPRASIATNPTAAKWPGLDARLAEETERVVQHLERVRTTDLFESTAAMLRLADAAFSEYDRLKRARGVLDFEDLVLRTANLLARADAPGWVHYKLDRGLEHILVDEAQDTSPRQWQVIERLASEFFVGEGVSAATRTIFAVGDEKQSIFSFQGAVPAWFSRMNREFGASAKAAGYTWRDRELHLSFRSAPKVLAAVDAVFASPSVHAGLNADPRPTVHEAHRRTAEGRVVLWPAAVPAEKPKTENWVDPVDHLGDDSPEVQVAKRIANTVRGWLDRGERLDGGRPIRPGGILVLTRSRGALTDAINRELKKNNVPIAGADRLTLTEHIAVMDLMAAARVALLPEDDLSLASVLKSPLIGLDEEALFALAHDRGPKTLWAALAEKAEVDPQLSRARSTVDRWRRNALEREPYVFFARILGPDGGRSAFLARLGAEAEDVLDEFLNQCLAYEQANVPSLEGFLEWLVAGETDIKRDTDTLRDEVRVMTVHGAKGLEADVVFLIDNGMDPAPAAHDPRVLRLDPDAGPMQPGPVVWNRSIGAMPAAVAQRIRDERVRTEEEYRRLLYVGMTRAKDRLYIAGIIKKPSKNDTRWHALVSAALTEVTEHKTADGQIEYEWLAAGAPEALIDVQPNVSRPDLPVWVRRAAAPAQSSAVRTTPSSALSDAAPPVRSLVARREAETGKALERGRLIHRLLESLPEAPEERRGEIGARYLDAAADKWPAEERAALLAEVIATVAHGDFAAAFASGSGAEVEIAGRLGSRVIAGRIDRLAVTPDRVLIVDFKTNRPAPAKLADVPEVYLNQLAIYRAVLRRLYPDRRIAAALLWTDVPALMEIPQATLDGAEAALLAAEPMHSAQTGTVTPVA